MDEKPGADANASAKPEAPTLLTRLMKAPITSALMAINLAVFVWAERSGGTTDEGTLLRFGAVEPLHVWAGEYWRVATYMFLHIGWIHILVNSYASFGWATTLEAALGKVRFLAVYLLAGVAGGCASVISGILFGAHLSAGASGALFGIIGATLALRARRLESFKAFFADRPVRSTLVQLAIWIALGFQLHFDNAAHVGGFAAGAVMAWLFTSSAPRAGWVAFAVGMIALFLGAIRPWWSPSGEHQNDIAIYARSYLTGKNPHPDTTEPWPVNVPRGIAFAKKGCSHGVAYACEVLKGAEGHEAPSTPSEH